jgi:hypothetical protein
LQKLPCRSWAEAILIVIAIVIVIAGFAERFRGRGPAAPDFVKGDPATPDLVKGRS